MGSLVFIDTIHGGLCKEKVSDGLYLLNKKGIKKARRRRRNSSVILPYLLYTHPPRRSNLSKAFLAFFSLRVMAVAKAKTGNAFASFL